MSCLGKPDHRNPSFSGDWFRVFGDAGHALEYFEVFRVKSFPFVDAVAQRTLRHQQLVPVYVELRDAHVVVFVADAHAPVGLAEKMMGFLHALAEAKQHGALQAVARIEFVLYEGIALVVAAGLVVVVVEPLVFQPDFAGHGAAEAGEFPGV